MKPLAALLIFMALPTQAQQVQITLNCGMRERIVTSLQLRFDEGRSGAGISSPEVIIELLKSETGTFTILATRSNGVSCILAAGTDWASSSGDKGPAF